MQISRKILIDIKARADNIDAVCSIIGDAEQPITEQLCRDISNVMNWDWVAIMILNRKQRNIFDDKTEPKVKAYRKSVEPLCKAYENNVAPARKSYSDAVEHAFKTYQDNVEHAKQGTAHRRRPPKNLTARRY